MFRRGIGTEAISSTSEEFENTGFTLKTFQVFPTHTTLDGVQAKQTPFILDLKKIKFVHTKTKCWVCQIPSV